MGEAEDMRDELCMSEEGVEVALGRQMLLTPVEG